MNLKIVQHTELIDAKKLNSKLNDDDIKLIILSSEVLKNLQINKKEN